MALTRSIIEKSLFALIVSYFIILLLPNGPGMTHDSVSFLEVGNNFWNNGQYYYTSKLTPEFAGDIFPLYTLIASAFHSHWITSILLQVTLYFTTILCCFKLIRINKSSVFLLLFFTSTSIVYCYYTTWTESLYGLLLLWLVLELRKHNKQRILMWLMLIVLLCYTRFVGIVVGGTLFLTLFIKKEFKQSIIVLFTTLMSIATWVIIGWLATGGTARTIAFHLPDSSKIVAFPNSLGQLILPFDSPYFLTVSVGLGLLVYPMAHLLYFRKKEVIISFTELFLVLHFYLYLLFILMSILFLDASTPIEFRTVFPLYLSLIALFTFHKPPSIKLEKRRTFFKVVLTILLLPLLIWHISATVELGKKGFGYNAAFWNKYPVQSSFEKLLDKEVFTNDKAALLHFSDYKVTSKPLPVKYNRASLKKNSAYEKEYRSLIRYLEINNHSRILWVRNGATASTYPSIEKLKSEKTLEVIEDSGVYIIFKGLP